MRMNWRVVDREDGVALVMALGCLLAVSAVAAAVALLAMLETHVSSGSRWRQETLASAEAALELTCAALAGEADWNLVLAGPTTSPLPGASGSPEVAGWGRLDAGDADGASAGAERRTTVWGANAARWRLYAHGRPEALFLSGRDAASPYVAVWVADDDADDDGAPERDTNGAIALRAEAYGVGRAHQVVLATVRHLPHGTEVVSWRVPADRQTGS